MRVFLLTPGRSGSTTFFKAWEHSTNFSAGQQTNWGKLGDRRLDYPDSHVESDARLCFLTDEIADYYNKEEDAGQVCWVSIDRPASEIVESYSSRRAENGILSSYARGVLCLDPNQLSDQQWAEVSNHYVHNMNARIRSFLQNRRLVFWLDLYQPKEGFTKLWDFLAAEGDLTAALAEWDSKHNERKPSGNLPLSVSSLTSGSENRRAPHIYRTFRYIQRKIKK